MSYINPSSRYRIHLVLLQILGYVLIMITGHFFYPIFANAQSGVTEKSETKKAKVREEKGDAWAIVELDSHVNVMAMQPDTLSATALAISDKSFPHLSYYNSENLYWLSYDGNKWKIARLDDRLLQ